MKPGPLINVEPAMAWEGRGFLGPLFGVDRSVAIPDPSLPLHEMALQSADVFLDRSWIDPPGCFPKVARHVTQVLLDGCHDPLLPKIPEGVFTAGKEAIPCGRAAPQEKLE